MIFGSPPPQWIFAFEDIDTCILNLISTLWPKCLEVVDSNFEEDEITAELVRLMCNSVEYRDSIVHVRGQTELYTRRDGRTRIKGRHDIEFFVGPKALVYECKRVKPKKVQRLTETTLVDKYVKDGLNRFLKGQYAERDPFGGMIAYVIEGNCAIIRDQLLSCINDHALSPGHCLALPSINGIMRFSSSHSRILPSPPIKVHHAILAMA